jgi:hypothetical protein
MTAPPRPIIKHALPEKKYDGQGKVLNWSQLWPEAKELETLVVNGLVDDVTPAQLCQKYPSFSSFAYRPLASALTNIRRKHNKEVANRAGYEACGAVCEYHRDLSDVLHRCPEGFVIFIVD